MRIATSMSAALLVIAGCGSAPPAPTARARAVPRAAFETIDTDADDALDDGEFLRAAQRYYDVLDSDEDGRLTSVELAIGMFASWDRDGSGALDRAEHGAGVASWLPNEIATEFVDWDHDTNGTIDREEARLSLARTRLFQRYDEDGDGIVTDLELSAVVFQSWDLDGDERIDALEWRLD